MIFIPLRGILDTLCCCWRIKVSNRGTGVKIVGVINWRRTSFGADARDFKG